MIFCRSAGVAAPASALFARCAKIPIDLRGDLVNPDFGDLYLGFREFFDGPEIRVQRHRVHALRSHEFSRQRSYSNGSRADRAHHARGN